MKIDPGEVQILFSHLQPHLVEGSVTENPRRIERAADALVQTAAELSIPVTFALVPDGRGGIPIASIASHANDCNSFVGEVAAPSLIEGFNRRIDNLKRRIIVVSGISTEAAVLHSVIDAIDAGFRVFVPVDAVGSTSDRAERAALDHINRAGGEAMSTATLLSILAPDFRTEPGATILSRIKSLDV